MGYNKERANLAWELINEVRTVQGLDLDELKILGLFGSVVTVTLLRVLNDPKNKIYLLDFCTRILNEEFNILREEMKEDAYASTFRKEE